MNVTSFLTNPLTKLITCLSAFFLLFLTIEILIHYSCNCKSSKHKISAIKNQQTSKSHTNAVENIPRSKRNSSNDPSFIIPPTSSTLNDDDPTTIHSVFHISSPTRLDNLADFQSNQLASTTPSAKRPVSLNEIHEMIPILHKLLDSVNSIRSDNKTIRSFAQNDHWSKIPLPSSKKLPSKLHQVTTLHMYLTLALLLISAVLMIITFFVTGRLYLQSKRKSYSSWNLSTTQEHTVCL